MAKNRNTHFLHLRVKKNGVTSGKGGRTIAYMVDGDHKVTMIAVALCHEHDNFNKKIGRAKAAGRLNSSHYAQEIAPPVPELDFRKSTFEEWMKTQ